MCSLRDWPDWLGMIIFISCLVCLMILTIVVVRVTNPTQIEERCETKWVNGTKVETLCITVEKPKEARQ